MNTTLGGSRFENVAVPLLWGSRAILADDRGRLMVVDLAGEDLVLEIRRDAPAPGAWFRPTLDGFAILSRGRELYVYETATRTLRPTGLDLPECEISDRFIRIGPKLYAENTFFGDEIGIRVGNVELDPDAVEKLGAFLRRGNGDLAGMARRHGALEALTER